MTLLRQFLESSMDMMEHICWKLSISFLYGSIVAIWYEAGHIWTPLSSPTSQNQPGSGCADTKSIKFSSLDSSWSLPWIWWSLFAESHHYHSCMDPYLRGCTDQKRYESWVSVCCT
jgi:hypothetical protein